MLQRWIFTLLFLTSTSVYCQWYTDPHNPVAVCPHVQVRGGLVPDLFGGTYFFIEGPNWCSMMSHVCIDGQWSCPLPGVIIGPPTSAFTHHVDIDPDNNLLASATNTGDPTIPRTPAWLNKWSPNGDSLWHTFIFPDTLTNPSYTLSNGRGGCLAAIIYGAGMGISWYIQYFNSSGRPQFGWFDRPLLGTGSLYPASLISDGTGGGYAIWKQTVQDSVHTIRMQHVRSDGNFAFADEGIIIIEDAYYYYAGTSEYASCVGSFVLGWGTVGPPAEYHLTRFDSTGTVIWDRTDFNYPSSDLNYVISDRLGGLYLFYEDTTYSRIAASGDVVFSGHTLAPWSHFAYGRTVSSCGELSVLNWNEYEEVWALQKYDSLGIEVWAQPVPVLYGMPSGMYPYVEYITADMCGGVILCFMRYDATYFTRVDAYGNVGSSLYVNQESVHLPQTFQMSAFPNPFNDQINIVWTTSIEGTIWFSITNILGQQVLSAELPGSATRFIWNGLDTWSTPVSSGVYYATLRTGRVNQSMQIVLIK